MRSNVILLAAVLAFLPACVSRELTVRTDPPGARVYRDREDLGTTPLTVPFHYGGESEFLLLHEEGEVKYKPTRVMYDTSTFFYDTFPFDVLVEMTPGGVDDNHLIEIVLERDGVVDAVEGDPSGYVGALMKRAADLRERGRIATEMGPPAEAPLYPPLEAEPSVQPKRR